MNDNLQSETFPVPERLPESAPPVAPQHPAQTLRDWLTRFLACNPFFILSAALLLYGLYRISVDPKFLPAELSKLIFNFTSLQLYELLLVLTAILLARRQIWYDSTLLVGLENILVLVPFILLSEAALIDRGIVSTLCLVGGTMAVVRFGSLRRGIAELNMPPRLLVFGLLLLAANVTLSVTFRTLHESKAGTHVTEGPAFETYHYGWLLLLPCLTGLANVLPPPKHWGGNAPQRSWLPLGMFSLWIAATAVHLYSLGYVYDFFLQQHFLAPTLWILTWTLRHRLTDLLPQPDAGWQKALLIAPILITLVAATRPGNSVFLILTALNVVLYGVLYVRHREDRLALHLGLLSLVALLAGLPEEWGRALLTDFTRAKCTVTSVSAYLLWWVMRSRDPKRGVLGAVLTALASLALTNDWNQALYLAAQSGIVCLLIHSLFWEDNRHPGAAAVRIVTGLAWVTHSWAWASTGGNRVGWIVAATAGLTLAACVAVRLLTGNWSPRAVSIAAVLVLLVGPTGKLQTASVGPLATAGSFLLFGLGTLAALTKHRWNKKVG